MFCQNCGSVIKDNSISCTHCGVQIRVGTDPVTASLAPNHGKSWVVTLLLALLLPVLGVHRFYTGHIGIGILQLLTAGGCGIWWLIDVAMILLDSYKDSEGRPLVK